MTHANPQPTNEQYRARFCRLLLQAGKEILAVQAQREAATRETAASIISDSQEVRTTLTPNPTKYPIQLDGGIRGSEVELSPSNIICK